MGQRQQEQEDDGGRRGQSVRTGAGAGAAPTRHCGTLSTSGTLTLPLPLSSPAVLGSWWEKAAGRGTLGVVEEGSGDGAI